jgi:hypothetical protein
MISSYVIAESMRAGSSIEGVPLSLTKVERYAVSSATADQPGEWTLIHFEFEDGELERVISALAGVLKEEGGWYTEVTLAEEKIVIFAGKVFRYASGDATARAEAQAHGREHGVPESQLDWSE